MRPTVARLAVFAFVIAVASLAQAAPPSFNPARYVYVAPESFSPPGFPPDKIAELETALQKLHFPAYVVLTEHIGADSDQAAAKAIDELAEAWSSQPGYDVARSSIFLLSFNPRRYRLLVGSTWRREVIPGDGALKPYLENFRRAVSGTPKDPAGGALATLRAVDDRVWDAVDPVKVAARAEEAARRAKAAEEARARAELDNARASLRSGVDELQKLLEDAPAHISRSRGEAALDRAESVNQGDLVAIRAASDDVERAAEEIRPAVFRARHDRATEVLVHMVEWLVGIAVLGFAFGFAYSRRKRFRALGEAFDIEVASWRRKVDNALSQYTALHQEKDDIAGIALAKGKTAALRDRVMGAMDEIYLSVKGLGAHVEECVEQARYASWWNPEPLREAHRRLDAEFTFDTEQVNRKDLFGGETRTVRVLPATFAKEQAERFAACRADWDKLRAAVSADSTTKALADLDEGVAALIRRTKEAGIPERWLDGHPLLRRGAFLAGLESVLREDPIEAQEQIDRARAQHKGVSARIERVAKACSRISTVPATPSYEGDVPEAADPRPLYAEAAKARAEFAKILADGDTGHHEVLESAAERVVHLEKKAAERTQVLDAALRGVKRAHVAEAAGQAERDVRAAESHLASAEEFHAKSACAPIAAALRTAKGAIVAATRAASEAKRSCRTAAEHLAAETAAGDAVINYKLASAEAGRAVKTAKDLDQKKSDYERQVRELEKERAAVEKRVRGYGSQTVIVNNAPVVEQRGGDVDYAFLLLQQQAERDRWAAEENRARRAHEERMAEIEADRQREAARSSYHSSSSGSSWGSSSSSSSEGSSWGSSSSSSSSDGGSWGGDSGVSGGGSDGGSW